MQWLKRRFQAWRNRTTIRKQLSIFMALAVTLTIVLMVMFNYLTQTRSNIQQQKEALARVLALENQRLDSFAEDLSTFSLQLRSNSSFMSIATSGKALDYTQRQDVEAAVKAAYYARGDLVEVELYLVKQQQRYAIERSRRKIGFSENEDAAALPGYEIFSAKPNFFSMTPDERGLLRFTRTIIDAPRETPLAVVRLTVGSNAIAPLMQNHQSAQESLFVFGANGERYAMAQGFDDADVDTLLAGIAAGQDSFTAILGGKQYLCVAAPQSVSGFVLVGCKPMTVVNRALIATRNGSIAIGVVALAVTVLLAEVFIRFITEPLSKLAYRLRRVGTGNFKTKAALEGSFELIGLSEDVNRMMNSIDGLIERTYVATLNERTAQLIALEAQTNPHFLFNTLQAIGSEALARGQNELYRMVTALGALLRYSIKGGNLATLTTEIDHVEKYLLLQKARFGNRLTYHIDVAEALLPLYVPKLGVLSLVENSIVHGLREQVVDICIRLRCEVAGEDVLLTVEDNGCGITPEKLYELRAAIGDPAVTISQNIGLMNLASRLKLLYNGQARITLDSRQNPGHTLITLRIPLEVLRNVQDTAD